jgi:hypothetical protein
LEFAREGYCGSWIVIDGIVWDGAGGFQGLKRPVMLSWAWGDAQGWASTGAAGELKLDSVVLRALETGGGLERKEHRAGAKVWRGIQGCCWRFFLQVRLRSFEAQRDFGG